MLDPLLQERKIVLVYQILEMNRIKVFLAEHLASLDRNACVLHLLGTD